MTYPVDDAGNPRVDFVWGNMAMQPNDQRDVVTAGPEPLYPANGEGNFGWDATFIYPSEGLYSSVTQALSIGDKDGVNASWDSVTYRTVSVPADNHSTALTGYKGFPSFIQGAPYDDTTPNVVVPNVVGQTEGAATTALTNAGLVKGAVTTANNAGGATSGNDGKVKTQTPAAGTTVNTGASVALVKYNYVAPGYTISAAKYTGDGANMSYGPVLWVIIPGTTNKPSVGDRVTLSGTSVSAFNTTWYAYSVANDDAYTTGSTLVKAKALSSEYNPALMSAPSSYQTVGGLMTVPPHVTPSSVTFTRDVSYAYNVDKNVTILKYNPGSGTKLTMRLPDGVRAYGDIEYGLIKPDSNGWAERTVTLSNLSSGINLSEFDNATYTVQSSSVLPASGGTPAKIELIFTVNPTSESLISETTVAGTLTLNF